MTLRAADGAVDAVIEDAVREPSDGHRGRRDHGQLVGDELYAVAKLALLLEHEAFHARQLRRHPRQRVLWRRCGRRALFGVPATPAGAVIRVLRRRPAAESSTPRFLDRRLVLHVATAESRTTLTVFRRGWSKPEL